MKLIIQQHWTPASRKPKFGGEYLVVWRMDDGGYPTTTIMIYDAIGKTWCDPHMKDIDAYVNDNK